MAENRDVCGMLGLCRRAGGLAVGFDAAVAALKNAAPLALCAADASAKTVKELRFVSEPRGIPLLILPLTKEAVGAAIGARKPVGALAVTDAGLADALKRHCQQKEETL